MTEATEIQLKFDAQLGLARAQIAEDAYVIKRFSTILVRIAIAVMEPAPDETWVKCSYEGLDKLVETKALELDLYRSGMALADDTRPAIGTALQQALLTGADAPDWLDAREIDRLVDAVVPWIPPPRNSPASTGRVHELKEDPAAFQELYDWRRNHETRYDDRDYGAGDMLTIRETRYTSGEMRAGRPLEYTGRIVSRAVTCVSAYYGLHAGWVVLSLAPAAVRK